MFKRAIETLRRTALKMEERCATARAAEIKLEKSGALTPDKRNGWLTLTDR